MCARKMVITDPVRLREIFGVKRGPVPNFVPRYNLPITEREPIVRLDKSRDRTLELATWDYRDGKVSTLKGRPPFYNARAESMSKSAPFAERRCLVPVDGFYEWLTINGKKQPFLFRRKDRAPFAMGGVWSEWRDPDGGETILTYVELTTAPTPLVADIHNRMPLIIDQADWPAYLEGGVDDARHLARPNPLPGFERFAVSPAVNSIRAEGSHLIEPMAAPEPERTLFS